jgi:hypothetical protein
MDDAEEGELIVVPGRVETPSGGFVDRSFATVIGIPSINADACL